MFLSGCKSRQEHSFYEPLQNTIISTSDYDTLTREEINLLHNGDIIMRQGRGAVSLTISARLNEKYKISHCGILNIDKDSINVIHTLSLSVSSTDGMQQASLEEFVGDTYKNSIIVVRLKNSDNSKITNRAKYYLSQKIPFDDYFDFADTSKFFCNEMIAHILAVECNVNFIDTNAGEMQNLRFGRFIDTAKFDIVINHQNN
ncbi:MAG: hypothetical protein LBP85_04650 [Prevotellaceae bacterium]|jgi:hypothetical protein|nr:hypothetical protein [Prevotellaceae bacterium]